MTLVTERMFAENGGCDGIVLYVVYNQIEKMSTSLKYILVVWSYITTHYKIQK